MAWFHGGIPVMVRFSTAGKFMTQLQHDRYTKRTKCLISPFLVERDHQKRLEYDTRRCRQLKHRRTLGNVSTRAWNRLKEYLADRYSLLVRFIAGPLCDRYGPRLVFVGLLLCGAIPTAMAGLVTGPKGLIALRFFVGILGGTFVPCQVWCTGFFDKSIVGTANSLAGGWGNAGGGIT